MATLARSVNGSQAIRKEDVQPQGPLLDPQYTDDAAVQLTIQDMQLGATYLDQKQWNLFWRESDVLYQSPRTNQLFEGSTVARANISRFTVAQHVNSLTPTIKNGIFYENPPFLLRPRPAMKQSTARAKSALFSTLMDDANFEDESELLIEDQTLFGTCIAKAGFDKYTVEKTIRRPKTAPLKQAMPFGGTMTVHTEESDELESVPINETVEEVFFERCDLGTVVVAPNYNKPNRLHKAPWLIHVTNPTFEDLNRMRQHVVKDAEGKVVGGFDIPPDEELKNYFFSHPGSAGQATMVEQNTGDQNWAIHHAQNEEMPDSADPMKRPIKMLERWDRTWVYNVLCNDGGPSGVLIRKEKHGLPHIPFYSANFWNIPKAFWGMGVGRLAGSDQRIDKGLTDALLDMLSFIVNPQYARDRGANVPAQQIRQRLGGIIDVDVKAGHSVRDAFSIIEQPRVPGEIFPILQDSRTSARQTTGADEAFTSGNVPQKGTTSLRSATVGQGIMQANQTKIMGPVGHFVRGILLPFLELMDFLVKNRMSPGKIREILGEQMEADFELDAQNFYEAENAFECLAGAKLAAKKAMAQALPILTQVFENPALVSQLNQTGWMVDAKELVDMFMEVTEWKNERQLVRRMKPSEMRMFRSVNPAAQKVQGQVVAIQARHQARTAEIDQQNEADLAKQMIGKASDQAALFDERRWDREAINQSEFAPA